VKKFILSAATAALIGSGIAVAPPAPACVWDAAWFFLGQCNQPPAGPPLPPEQRQYDPQTNPGGYPWRWWDDGVEKWCPPSCL
jgi:hypothetical protein